MSAAKEFMSMMIKFRSVSRFTLRHHKEFIQSKLDELGLKKYVPGVQSSPGWIQAQEQLKFIGAMTDEELDNPDLLRGLRVRRISWKLGKPEKEIKDFIYEYYRFSEMQRFVKYLHAAGLPEPKNNDELIIGMSRHPKFQNEYTMTKRQRTDIRRRQKRGW